MSLLTRMPTDITNTIFDLLDIRDLTTFSFTSKISFNLSKDLIEKYKQKEIFDVISFFTNHTKKKISLCANAYNKPKAADNVKKIFKYIPELFNFIQEFEIEELCFSAENSVKFLMSIDAIIPVKKEELPLLLKILENLQMNTTLKKIHLGLFSHYIEGNQNLKCRLEHIIDLHPALTACEIRNIGNAVFSSAVGNNLYKISKGVLVWQHFDPTMFVDPEGYSDDEYWDGED
jgi:hypothetical protein